MNLVCFRLKYTWNLYELAPSRCIKRVTRNSYYHRGQSNNYDLYRILAVVHSFIFTFHSRGQATDAQILMRTHSFTEHGFK